MLHDLDVSGLSILRTLRTDTRRYAFENEIEMIDLGLRLEDVMACALEDEAVTHDNPDALGARRRILRISEAPRPVGWTAQMRARLHASHAPLGPLADKPQLSIRVVGAERGTLTCSTRSCSF